MSSALADTHLQFFFEMTHELAEAARKNDRRETRFILSELSALYERAATKKIRAACARTLALYVVPVKAANA